MALPRKDTALELEDRLIIEAAIRGDRRAAHALYERHREQVWRVVSRLVIDPEITKEICQETWLKGFSSLARFRAESRFSTWILRIAINLTNSRMRWAKVRKHVSVEEADEEGIAILPTRSPTQIRSVEMKRENFEVEKALAGLSRKQRQAVILRYFEELPYSEMARVMGCRESSIRTHLKRAFRTLEGALADKIDIEERGE